MVWHQLDAYSKYHYVLTMQFAYVVSEACFLIDRAGRGGELDSLNQVSTDACIDGISSNRDIVVGVKIRLAEDVADGGRNEVEAYRCL